MKATVSKRIISVCVAAFVLVMAVLTSMIGTGAVAYAAERQYSDVMSDLQKDSSFDSTYYPVVVNDYSLKVIQIAESVDKDLFVYVYQPSGKGKDYRASYIVFTTEINDNISPTVYELEYVNSNSTLYKYVVKGFTVLSVPTRYYTITEILRPWDKAVDNPSGTDNTISNVPFAVEKQYTFGMINGKTYVEVTEIETIEVTKKWVGFVRYPDGWSLYPVACDNHFVEFNTNRSIDTLLEADVSFRTQHYSQTNVPFTGTKTSYGEISKIQKVTLRGENKSYTGNGHWAGRYEWNTIQTVNEFLTGEERNDVYEHALFNHYIETKLTDEAKSELRNGYSWVLRFTSTDYSYGGDPYSGTSWMWCDVVEDVIILRLKFVYDGITYNLGVIDNMQSGDRVPDNAVHEKFESKFGTDLWGWILAVLGLILLVVILAPILPFIIQALIWLIVTPFKLIAAGIKGIKNSVKNKRE